MRPRRLRFSGLRSYRAEADIDFSDLDLFAVIGDTGAGKSTIIEALCLALYGKKTWSGDSLKDVIADGEDMMRVEFTFDADGHTWIVQRARRRKAGPGQDLLKSTTNHVPDVNGHGQVTQRVVDLLGLSFDQFTRAVVMPQGRFDELLRSTTGTRNQILKSLLGLEDMTRAAKAAVEARDEVRPIHERYLERRRAFPADPQAELRDATMGRDVAVARRSLLERSVEAIGGPLATQQAAATVRGPLSEALAALGSQPDDVVEVLRSCHEVGARLHEELAEVKADLDKAKGSFDAASEEIEVVLAGFPTTGHLTAAASRAEDAVENLPGDLEALAGARRRRSALEEAAPATGIDPALVERERDTAQEVADLRRAEGVAKDARAEARSAWARFLALRDGLPGATSAAAAARQAHESARSDVAAVEERLTAAGAELANAQAAVEAAQVADRVAAVAVGHGAGDPCPVCSRELPSDFVVPDSADLDAARNRLDAATAARDAVGTELRAQRDRASELAATARLRSDAEATAQADLEAERVEAAGLGVDIAAHDDDRALAALDTAVERSADRLGQAEAAAQAASVARATAEAALEGERIRHADQVVQAENEVGRAQAALDRYVTMLVGLPSAWRRESEPTADSLSVEGFIDLGSRLAAAKGSVEAAAKRRADAEGAMAKGEARREAIRANAAERVTQPAAAALAQVNRHLTRVRAVVERARQAAKACALDVEFPDASVEEVPDRVTTADLPDTIAATSQRLGDATHQVEVARRVLTEVEAAERSAAEAVASALAEAGCETVDELHGQLGQARSQEQQAEHAVAAAAVAVTQAAAVDEVLNLATPLREDLEVLCAALGNNQFVDHLLDRREAELLAEASRRLKALTGDKFGFVADFGVKNTASGEIRSPDSLSGGERFQASLALALALVEIASRGAGRLDAVFVDEGFGSLDQNALETALATLGRVAGGGKTVALISHLQAVAEYVDTVMHVTRDDVFGSKIRTLTEPERDQFLSDDIRSGLTG
ncbi:SMC family ATPase [Iamia majanohamensis]|uniref:Nuclease SbcCD subunit C n=1 Tax=Iamia majanohamensis TaxID=467976 RepID=A0AAE9Y5Z1_9ACTN|nr:SMC family ATPase [Iamia majanohamensis]WCO67249.1 SMC family ATPase [Iamia majanohamensis]